MPPRSTLADLQPVAAGAKGGPVRVERAADRITVHAGGTSLQFTPVQTVSGN